MGGFFDNLGDIVSGIGDFVGGVGQFAQDNRNWITPLATAGLGYYGIRQQEKAQDEYEQYLRDAEDYNYAQTQAMRDYYAQNSGGGSGGGGGGGGGGNRAALAANARAQQVMSPYHEAAMAILPQLQQTYGDGLKNLSMLQAYMMTPEYQQQMKLPTAPILPIPGR